MAKEVSGPVENPGIQVRRLLKKLDGLPSELRKRAMNLAFNAAFKDMKAEAQRSVSNRLGGSGRLEKAVKVKKDLRKSGVMRARLFVNYKGRWGAPHAHLLHDGTKERFVKEDRWFSTGRGFGLLEAGTSLGKVRGYPFMEKVWDRNERKIIPLFNERIVKALATYAKKGKV